MIGIAELQGSAKTRKLALVLSTEFIQALLCVHVGL